MSKRSHSPLILRELTDSDEAAFFEGLAQWSEADRSWYTFAWEPGMSYLEMLEILRKERLGIELRPDRVQHSILYGFVEDKIVGRVSVRHTLNEYLSFRGGHLGYSVAEPFRRRGYARAMVTQALAYCRTIGLNELLITCADSNVASYQLIEQFSARLEGVVLDPQDQQSFRRYWLSL